MDFVHENIALKARGSKKKGRKSRPAIPRDTIVQLWLAAGGRCSFPNCCEPVAWNTLTYSKANFANIAHIVSWTPDGPRGADPLPVELRNELGNLMLVCRRCHKEIDDDKLSVSYPVEKLRRFKIAHEESVAYHLSLMSRKRTTVLTFFANVNSSTPAIVFEDILKAVSPRVPKDHDGIAIRLTETPGQETQDYYETHARSIDTLVQQRVMPLLMSGNTDHLSVIGLAPIPLLVKLGNCISNKVETRLFQRHRSSESWVWPEGHSDESFTLKRDRVGTNPLNVALIVEVSGHVLAEVLPDNIDESFSLYRLTLNSGTPSPVFLKHENTLSDFREIYARSIATLKANHLGLKKTHFFPAVPAPIAILCGRELLPKADPTLVVYDFNKQRGQFCLALEVN